MARCYFCHGMHRNTISLIIVIMSIALLGIIFLQIYWIKHDFSIKEQQFDQQVTDVLHAVSDRLETQQALSFIDSRLFAIPGDSGFWKTLDSSLSGLTTVHTVNLIGPDQNTGEFMDSFPAMNENDEPNQNGFHKVVVVSDSSRMGNSILTDRISLISDSLNNQTELNRLRTQEEIIRNERLRVKNDMINAEIDRKRVRMEQELIRMKVKVNSKVMKLNEVMNRIALSYVKEESDPMNKVSLSMVDSVLAAELANRGISTNYRFGIQHAKSDSLFMPGDTSYAAQLKGSRYRIRLFPNELVTSGQMLLLSFPNKTTFVLSSMLWMLAGSVIFTLTVIVVFVFTLVVLLRQKKLSEIKSDFISNMTHEFKTPIATISLAIDAINNPKVAEDRQKVSYYSNIIREENKRMNRQVETILQTALFEKKDFKLKRRKINLHDLISHAVENISLQVQARGGTIRMELNAADDVISGDEVLLTTAIVNLLDNANKYSPEAPQITLRTENRQEGILISVEDKGMGMTRETMNRIFEKFYRQSSGNIHDVKGFGLGLSNVKAIVTAHGGEIKVNSTPGEGSCFEIYLPHGSGNGE